MGRSYWLLQRCSQGPHSAPGHPPCPHPGGATLRDVASLFSKWGKGPLTAGKAFYLFLLLHNQGWNISKGRNQAGEKETF